MLSDGVCGVGWDTARRLGRDKGFIPHGISAGWGPGMDRQGEVLNEGDIRRLSEAGIAGKSEVEGWAEERGDGKKSGDDVEEFAFCLSVEAKMQVCARINEIKGIRKELREKRQAHARRRASR
ncbi:hypothetical protein Tco_0504964 [Tanacetum coccineum]